MRCRQLAYLLLLGAAALATPYLARTQTPAAGEVRWRHDYNSARKEAQEKNLPLVLDFGTKGCYWCVQLDLTTFRDPRIAGVMNERFIPLKIDADMEPQLTQALRIERFPTLVMAAPDGKILHTVVGFQDAGRFHESLQRALAVLTPPDWMVRKYQLALKAKNSADYPQAIYLLKTLLEDGKSRPPLQTHAQKMFQDLELEAAARVKQAKLLGDQGQSKKAIDKYTEIIRLFPGLASTKEATLLLGQLAQNQDLREQQNSRRAGELLAQAQEFFETREYLLCLDRCEVVLNSYGHLAEGQKAQQLITKIKNDPEWMQNAVEVLSERLGGMYLAMAEAQTRKGNPQLAMQYFERVIRIFPGTRLAESAQIRLQQLRGLPTTQPVDLRIEELRN